jgi:hypothetical protein
LVTFSPDLPESVLALLAELPPSVQEYVAAKVAEAPPMTAALEAELRLAIWGSRVLATPCAATAPRDRAR